MKMKKLAIGMAILCCVMTLSGAAWCGDNGNGTVTVNGLVWLKDAGCLGMMNWNSAMNEAANLASGRCGLTDQSKAGNWRLPNKEELTAIYSSKGDFSGVRPSYYWSSTSHTDPSKAWMVYMNFGYVIYGYKDSYNYVWPVRAEQ